MQIPAGPNGKPTLSASQFRTYGTGSFSLEETELPKGCPRKYWAKYVERAEVKEEFSYPLQYGSLFHKILQHMDEDQMDPDEALAAAFDPSLPYEMWQEARADLDGYLARGSVPWDRFATLGTELDLTMHLYDDEEFGPTYYRGFIDWVGVDPEQPSVIHMVDYKTNRSPAKASDLDGDVQCLGYNGLILANADMFVQAGSPRVVTHLDLVKFRDVEVAYSRQAVDEWKDWAIAMARKIWRDEEHEPVLNTMCSSCPIRYDCPAYEGMPMEAQALAGQLAGLQDPEARYAWRERANQLRLTLEKSVKAVDEEFKAYAVQHGELIVGGKRFAQELEYGNQIDLRRLHQLTGDQFYSIAGASKTALEKFAKSVDPSLGAEVMACLSRVPTGSKVAIKDLVG